MALTAYAMPGDKEKCLAAGMTDYITKPINRDGLLSTVQKFIKINWHHAEQQQLADKSKSKAAAKKRPPLQAAAVRAEAKASQKAGAKAWVS